MSDNLELRRVIHFVPYFPPHQGGLELYAKEWAENYVKLGGNILIVTFSPGQSPGGDRVENGYEIIVLPAFDLVHNFPVPKFWLPSFWKGLRKIKEFRPEILHTHTRFFLSTLLGGLYAKKNKLRWIHIEHGSGFVVSANTIITRASRFYDATIGKWSLTHADSVITVSKACEAFVRKEFGITMAQTIYRGIDASFGSPKRDIASINLGFIGRLVDLKGVNFLLEAFSLVLDEYKGEKPLKLRIVGDGPNREKLEKHAENLRLGSSVEFLGMQPVEFVRKEFLPSLHIFVNPSLQEGLPTTVIEALVSQCQVVATDVGGTRELLQHAPFILVAPGSARALADGIIEQLGFISLDSRIPPTTTLFSWERAFQEFSKIYYFTF